VPAPAAARCEPAAAARLKQRRAAAAGPGGYYATAGTDASILLRMKEDQDSAEPAASSVAVANLARLAALAAPGSAAAGALGERAAAAAAAFAGRLADMPLALPQICASLHLLDAGARRRPAAGTPAARQYKTGRSDLRAHPAPGCMTVHKERLPSWSSSCTVSGARARPPGATAGAGAVRRRQQVPAVPAASRAGLTLLYLAQARCGRSSSPDARARPTPRRCWTPRMRPSRPTRRAPAPSGCAALHAWAGPPRAPGAL